MGQKVNPISLRLEKTNRHFDSCWYDDYNYTDLLLQDLKIKNYFKAVLNQINYPEGRILIENLPKKSNINLFYCNPSNSRRKKKIKFQLQDYKDNKKKKIHKKKTSFFGFPEQKYWNQEKNFTLAHPGLEGWKNSLTAPLHLYKKNVQKGYDGLSFPKVEKNLYQEEGASSLLLKSSILTSLAAQGTELLQLRKPLYSVSDLTQTKKRVVQTGTENGLSPKGDQLPYSNLGKNKEGASSLAAQGKDNKDNKEGKCSHKQRQENKKTKEYSKIKEIMDYFLGFDKQGFLKSTREGIHTSTKKGHLKYSDYFLRFETKKRIAARGLLPNPSVDKHLVVRGKTISYKEGDNDINKFLLQFVSNNNKIDSNKSVGKQNMEKKWVVERFFVRYLLAQLYGKFLQNKSVYSQENLRTLYQFRMFFPEKNNIQKTISTINFKKPSIHPKDRSLLGKQDITKKVQIKESKVFKKSDLCLPCLYKNKGKDNKEEECSHNQPITSLQKIITVLPSIRGSKKRVLPGLYSSNRVYKSHLESFLSNQYNSFFNLHLFRTLIEKQGALFLVQEIVYYLERKMPFRRIKTQILREIPHYKHIKGVRITCSGRVGGRSKKAQRSKTQSVKIGQTPLGVFSSKIDFASKSALTRFGLIGVKVWICYQ